MKHRLISMLTIPVVTICFGVISGSSAIAQSADTESAKTQSGDRDCSNRSIFGAYGSASQGVLLPAPGVVLQFRSVQMTRFDGRGNLTWMEHTVINGTPAGPGWTPARGTYTVNSDCTGMATVNTPNSPVPLNLFFVVVKHGTEIHMILNSDAVSTVFNKVE
ncbi:hypothetical protein [Tunturiibacter gelidiferens]|uniref:hypothetical protein n=1 Tax=Tunturiibacter gelidiferens TaxID=3069689 RepID=UPI003D9AC59F